MHRAGGWFRGAAVYPGSWPRHNFPETANLLNLLFGLCKDRGLVDPERMPEAATRRYYSENGARTLAKKGAEKMIAKVDKNECTGCGICADECPAVAIKVNDVAVVDASLCTGCGACVDACPSGALSMV